MTTSLKVWPGWVATPEKADAKNFQQLKRRRMGCLYEVISPLSSLVNNQGLALLAGRVLALRHWTETGMAQCGACRWR